MKMTIKHKQFTYLTMTINHVVIQTIKYHAQNTETTYSADYNHIMTGTLANLYEFLLVPIKGIDQIQHIRGPRATPSPPLAPSLNRDINPVCSLIPP
mgnify:CR=1 FL=1